jgi:hypothetical protein
MEQRNGTEAVEGKRGAKSSLFCFVSFCFCLFEAGLALLLTQTHNPTSTSQVLGLQVCATMPG